MIRIKDHKTRYIFDPWDYLCPKGRKLMEESRAGVFRQEILNELPVNEIASTFSDIAGRPTKELYRALGSLVLQQMQDLTDEETSKQVAFNLQWHYALDITDPVQYAAFGPARDRGANQAQARGVELIAPVMGSLPEGRLPLFAFTFSDQGEVLNCPAGHPPFKTQLKKDRPRAFFPAVLCEACPLKDPCPTQAGKDHRYLGTFCSSQELLYLLGLIITQIALSWPHGFLRVHLRRPLINLVFVQRGEFSPWAV